MRSKQLSSTVHALTIHADYRCRQSGACCSADWDVPVELPVYRSLRDALEGGTLSVARHASQIEPFVLGPDLPESAAAMLDRTPDGRCVFLEAGAPLCIVHRDLGEEALPATCRHFPRLAVQDARGTFVSLSHFCPTAAGMLFRTDVPLAIVESPPAFPPRDYDGLTVTEGDLPPLLHPHMLMDLDGYAAWESHMVRRCAERERSPESVLATLRRDAALARAWRPGGRSLAATIACLPDGFVEAAAHGDLTRSLALHTQAMGAVPEELRPAPDEHGLAERFVRDVAPRWDDFRAPLTRFLAAKAFASWTAYQGRGVATIVRGLEAAVALVRVEAARQCRNADRRLDADLLLESFRAADFILNHLAVGEDLAAGWSRIETAVS